MSSRNLIRWLALAALMVPGIALAKGKKSDTVWLHPAYANAGVDRIALLPAATYDNSFETATLVEQTFGQAFHGTDYHWMSADNVRRRLRTQTGSDSLLRAVQANVLARGRIDSTDAAPLCAHLGVDAVLSLRVDQWEKRDLEWSQSGKPTTQVGVRAALVDSAGRLLYSIFGSQFGEGSYHEADAPPTGMSAGLNNQPGTPAPAPPFLEVVTPLFTRWVSEFPGKAQADSLRAPAK